MPNFTLIDLTEYEYAADELFESKYPFDHRWKKGIIKTVWWWNIKYSSTELHKIPKVIQKIKN